MGLAKLRGVMKLASRTYKIPDPPGCGSWISSRPCMITACCSMPGRFVNPWAMYRTGPNVKRCSRMLARMCAKVSPCGGKLLACYVIPIVGMICAAEVHLLERAINQARDACGKTITARAISGLHDRGHRSRDLSIPQQIHPIVPSALCVATLSVAIASDFSHSRIRSASHARSSLWAAISSAASHIDSAHAIRDLRLARSRARLIVSPAVGSRQGSV